eukprot:m.132303 g.132303  ORF g.132303 m.132303 type:complete len:320 (-) comp16480_c0_seq2:407-1366(-)
MTASRLSQQVAEDVMERMRFARRADVQSKLPHDVGRWLAHAILQAPCGDLVGKEGGRRGLRLVGGLAKVDDPYVARGVEQEVVGLDVAVADAEGGQPPTRLQGTQLQRCGPIVGGVGGGGGGLVKHVPKAAGIAWHDQAADRWVAACMLHAVETAAAPLDAGAENGRRQVRHLHVHPLLQLPLLEEAQDLRSAPQHHKLVRVLLRQHNRRVVRLERRSLGREALGSFDEAAEQTLVRRDRARLHGHLPVARHGWPLLLLKLLRGHGAVLAVLAVAVHKPALADGHAAALAAEGRARAALCTGNCRCCLNVAEAGGAREH